MQPHEVPSTRWMSISPPPCPTFRARRRGSVPPPRSMPAGQTVNLASLQADWRQQSLRLLAPVRIGFSDGVTIDKLRLGLRQAVLEVSGRAGATLDLTASLRNLPADLVGADGYREGGCTDHRHVGQADRPGTPCRDGSKAAQRTRPGHAARRDHRGCRSERHRCADRRPHHRRQLAGQHHRPRATRRRGRAEPARRRNARSCPARSDRRRGRQARARAGDAGHDDHRNRRCPERCRKRAARRRRGAGLRQRPASDRRRRPGGGQRRHAAHRAVQRQGGAGHDRRQRQYRRHGARPAGGPDDHRARRAAAGQRSDHRDRRCRPHAARRGAGATRRWRLGARAACRSSRPGTHAVGDCRAAGEPPGGEAGAASPMHR